MSAPNQKERAIPGEKRSGDLVVVLPNLALGGCI
jgi:hypothetical protein